MEDVWRGEAQDLLTQIAQLQEENKQLMTNLSHKDINFTEEEFQKHEGKFDTSNSVLALLQKAILYQNTLAGYSGVVFSCRLMQIWVLKAGLFVYLGFLPE